MTRKRQAGWRLLASSWPVALVVGFATPAPFACPEPGQAAVALERFSEADLKALYLGCARESARQRLSPHDAARCSAAAELLKERSFGGDFDALLAWWRRQGG
jgi:hypothetical protein